MYATPKLIQRIKLRIWSIWQYIRNPWMSEDELMKLIEDWRNGR